MLRATSEASKTALYFRPRCKLWSCPVCGPINARMWAARIYDATAAHLSNGSRIAFTTLTSHEKLGQDASRYVFRKAWPKLRKRASRAASGGEYVLIPEFHQDGRLHAHMLDTYALPKRWWKDNARACGLGYMADTEFAESPHGAANYATKYLTKAIVDVDLKNFRRIRKSKGFLNGSQCSVMEGWEVMPLESDEALRTDVLRYKGNGWEVKLLTHWEVWENAQQEN